MVIEVDGDTNDVVVQNGKERRLVVHRNVLYEFTITWPHQDVVDFFFASAVESV